MAEPQGLSEDELQNLRDGMRDLIKDLESSSERIFSFSRSPIGYLRRFGIKVLDYIAPSPELRMQFTRAIREVIAASRNMVNRCLACKIATLLMLFAILGKSILIGWRGILEVIDKIKDGIKEYFEKTSAEVDSIFQRAEEWINAMKPSHLAIMICEVIGLCPA